ncbi:papain-like cysteine protease family protein [Ralstonia pseudosolanacearum]
MRIGQGGASLTNVASRPESARNPNINQPAPAPTGEANPALSPLSQIGSPPTRGQGAGSLQRRAALPLSPLAATSSAKPGYRGGYISVASSAHRNIVSGVPYKEQSNDFGCWDACMNMIRAYFDAPEIGKKQVSFLYNKDGSPKPIDALIDYKTRNKYANLVNVSIPSERAWDTDNIQAMLNKHGPVEALINVDENFEHNIVLIGVDAKRNSVIYHDPAVGPSREMSIPGFNDIFCWERYRSALTAYKQ